MHCRKRGQLLWTFTLYNNFRLPKFYLVCRDIVFSLSRSCIFKKQQYGFRYFSLPVLVLFTHICALCIPHTTFHVLHMIFYREQEICLCLSLCLCVCVWWYVCVYCCVCHHRFLSGCTKHSAYSTVYRAIYYLHQHNHIACSSVAILLLLLLLLLPLLLWIVKFHTVGSAHIERFVDTAQKNSI